MTISTVIEFAGMIGAFAAFAFTLAWAQSRTDHVAIKPIVIDATTRSKRRPFQGLRADG